MNSGLSSTAALIGRILLAVLFVLAGFSKIGGFEGTAAYIASKGEPAYLVYAGVEECEAEKAAMLELGARYKSLLSGA